jgi:catechol 2,3-dioxygenase-like lactoylglutathione lyase family enzyme
MHPTGITANLSVADLAEARDFYVGFLGLAALRSNSSATH